MNVYDNRLLILDALRLYLAVSTGKVTLGPPTYEMRPAFVPQLRKLIKATE